MSTWFDRGRRWLVVASCALHGHDLVLAHAPRRLFLTCVSCGYRTPGLTIDQKPPVATRANVVRFRRRLKVGVA